MLPMVTEIDWVVAPWTINTNFTALDVNVTLPPAQKVVDPLGVMVGVAGAAFTVTVVPALAALWQPEHLSLNDMLPRYWLLKSTGLLPWTINTNYPHLTLTLPRYHRKRLLIRLSYGGVAGAAFTVTVVP
jgi:hypothetical protein